MDISLTQRQMEALTIIKESLKSKGMAPSLGEMMEEMDISTKKGVVSHLKALEKKGYIIRTGGERGINLTEEIENDNFISVPLLGFANAGEPLMTAEDEYMGELTVDKNILKGSKKVFGVELRGDSMNKKELNGVRLDNGNYAIVAKDTEVKNGDVVLAVIDEGATVKTFNKENNLVVLYPESNNEIHKPIYIDENRDTYIAGKVVTVLSNPTKNRNRKRTRAEQLSQFVS
jgi:repressor LexA